jgi:hypothetical protein
VVERGGRELGIDRRQRYVLTLRESLDLTPPLGYPFIEWKQPARETNTQIAIEPALKRTSLRVVVSEEVDAFSNFSDGDDAQVQ